MATSTMRLILSTLVVFLLVTLDAKPNRGKKKDTPPPSLGKISISDGKVNAPNVVELDKERMSLIIHDANWPAFVLFSKLKELNSQIAAEAFGKAAAALINVLPCGHMDCSNPDHKEPCVKLAGKSYPQFLFFPAGDTRKPIFYTYDSKEEFLLNFALGNLDRFVAHVEPNEVQSFVRKASIMPRAIFFTNNKWLDIRLNTMAFQHRMRTAFAQVSNPSNRTLSEYGITRLPAVVLYPKDKSNTDDAIVFQETIANWGNDGWGSLGNFVQNHTLRNPVSTEKGHLRFHQEFDSVQPVVEVEMLDAEKFDDEVVGSKSGATVVLFFHRWNMACRRLFPVYETAAKMMANESIDVAAFDFDDGGSEAKRIQMNFAITNLPAILFFPGERRDPAKMSTLDRNIVTDREVTPEEIVEWSKSQVRVWKEKVELEAAAEAERKAKEEVMAKKRAELGLSKEKKAKTVILALEDSTEEEQKDNIEKQYSFDYSGNKQDL